MVRVHHFKRWDIDAGDWQIPSFKAAIEFVIMSGGETIPGTVEEVEPSSLDDQGRYHVKAPVATKPRSPKVEKRRAIT